MADQKKKSVQPSSEPKLDIVAIELRRAREARGLTHSELHRQTGISRPVLFGYEAGRTKPGAKELRLLAETLGVTPNRLLFGTEEPFKPRPGLRSLVKLRNSPMMILIVTMLMPIAFAALDDDQVESLLTMLASLVESRDKESYKKISAIVEVFSEEIGNGTPAEMSALAERWKNPAYQSEISKRIDEHLAHFG